MYIVGIAEDMYVYYTNSLHKFTINFHFVLYITHFINGHFTSILLTHWHITLSDLKIINWIDEVRLFWPTYCIFKGKDSLVTVHESKQSNFINPVFWPESVRCQCAENMICKVSIYKVWDAKYKIKVTWMIQNAKLI